MKIYLKLLKDVLKILFYLTVIGDVSKEFLKNVSHLCHV